MVFCRVVQGPSTVHFVALLTTTGFGTFCILSADGEGGGMQNCVEGVMDQVWKWHSLLVPRFHWPKLSHMTTPDYRGDWEV